MGQVSPLALLIHTINQSYMNLKTTNNQSGSTSNNQNWQMMYLKQLIMNFKTSFPNQRTIEIIKTYQEWKETQSLKLIYSPSTEQMRESERDKLFGWRRCLLERERDFANERCV